MGNSLPAHQFYFNLEYHFLTMILHDLEYDIAKSEITYYAKDKYNKRVVFSDYPDWRGPRPTISIPSSICDRLARSKERFKVILMCGFNISPFLVAFSERLDTNLTPSIPDSYVEPKYSLSQRITMPYIEIITKKGIIWDTKLIRISGIDLTPGLLIPEFIYETFAKKITPSLELEILHDSENNVGGLNIKFL